MLANRSMPPGSVIPELAYSDVRAAAAWLCDAFGFRERLRIADHRIQLQVGDGALVVTARPAGILPDAGSHGVMVRVDDADRHHARAVSRGATIIRPPADHPYGERQYTAQDPGGHRWTFSQTIADADPADWGGVLVTER
jgi:uncharacterized glyoxalase superfamily protein PhnB